MTATDTLLIQVDGAAGRPVELPREQQVTFGRGAPNDPVDVRLRDPAGAPVAGRIRAADGYWLISNLSRDRAIVVQNHEGGGEFLTVPPGRLDMPVPFEFAKVLLPSSAGPAALVVTAPEPSYLDGTAPAPDPAFALDESAKYFLVLVALCEPRLRDPWSPVIPSAPAIVARLRPLASCRDLTRAAVNFHIDYLARTKVPVSPVAHEGAPRADWRRAALVSVALRFDLVRPEHQALLPGRRRPTAGSA